MKNEPQRQGNDIVPDAAMDQIFQALVDNGSVIPETPDEVRRALARLQGAQDALPVHLRDSARALKRVYAPAESSTGKIIPISGNVFAETQEGLQRAARKGDEISATVEARMKLNRLKATHERQG